MKKVRYSFISLLLVSFFIAWTTSVDAQIYSHPMHRTKFFFNGNPDGTGPIEAKGGSAMLDWVMDSLLIKSRGAFLLKKKIFDGINVADRITPTPGPGDINSGYLADSYVKITEVVEVLSGEEFTIDCKTGKGWANAALFIDWDGNGVFDDHELLKYNSYKESCVAREEYHNVNASVMNPLWTIKVPKTFVEEKLIRCRIKFDEGSKHYMLRRNQEIYSNGIPGCSNMGQNNQDGGLNGTKQYFLPMALNRFMPSASPHRGTTTDFDILIKPNVFLAQTIDSESIVSEMGSVVCESAEGIAISDEAGFEAFLNKTSGNFYLANDITISSTLDVSQSTFSGTFDGNGHTITINPTTASKSFNATSRESSFYPYGTNSSSGNTNEVRNNILTLDWGKGITSTSVATASYPEKTIGGGFCGVLDFGGVIKNVKVVYSKSCTYQGTGSTLFGLVAGINKGCVENVSIHIAGGSTVKVESNGTTVGACGGVAGVLFRGIVKNCAVKVDGTLSFGKNSGTLPRESTLGGLIGRLQAGVVGSVKFSGEGKLALAATNNTTYSRYYIGGIAGMTNTPQGAFCGDFQYEWGYDNGTVGLDVNNVILSFTGAMDMGTANAGTTHNYYCRGLLFAEATDSATVPNLVTQYANALTIEKSAVADQSISGTAIPLISTTAGNCGTAGKLANSPVKNAVGKLYLYKDGRLSSNSTLCTKYTNVTTADTELNWAYEVQNIRDEAGNVTCVAYSTPYVVATYTGTNANIQGIEAASANVSDLGSAMVKIDPQPETVASPSWTWSETATPVTPDTDSPVCGGGGGETTLPLLTYCTPGNQGNSGQAGQRSITSFTINGTTIAVNETSANYSPAYRGYKNTEANAIEVKPGQTFTISSNHQDNWIHINAFVDWNHDGVFERIGRSPNADLGGAASFTVTVPNDASIAYTPLRLMLAWLDVNDACTFSSPDNPCIAVDIVLKVVEDVPVVAPTYPTYCVGTAPNNSDGDHYGINAGYVKVNGTQAFDFTHTESVQDFSATKVVNVCPGDIITLGVNGGQHLAWSQAIAYVDWNKDGTWNENSEAYEIFNNDNFQDGRYREKDITVPADVTDGAFCIRICSGEAPAHNSLGGGPCQARKRGRLSTFGVNVACAAGGGATNTYCAQPTFTSHTTGTTATGYLKNLTANGVALATNWNSNQSQNTVGNTITINPGENLNLDFTFQCDWNNGGDNKGLNWTTAFAFVDLNGDGDFTDSGERIYARGGGGCNRATDAILPDGRTGSDATWTGTKTVTLTAASKSMLRIYTIGEYNDDFVGSTNGSKAAFDTGCATGGLNGDSGSNKFHCYDFPIVINVPAAGGGSCAYVADFGNVYAGEVATYDIKLGAGSAVTIDADVADDEYTLLPYNNATGILTVTYNVPAALGAVAVDSIGAITNGDKYRIAVSATVKAAPTVTFRMSDKGGGALSLDMGKTTFIESRTFAPYKGELLTAVPVGPTHIEGWYVSTDGGTTFNAVGHTNPDYTYTGADDAIVEVRFDFDNFEGEFGLARFTDSTNPPFYISSVKATGGIVNIVGANGTDSVPMFTDNVVGGEVRWMYKEDARLQTLKPILKVMTHNVTVSLKNGTTIPANARLLCFIDYNMNNYFDFTSSPDGLASKLTKNNELVYVGTPNGDTNQTFTFTISNADVTKFGKTRMRFMVATYVDMYGLGPVNQYGFYQPRIDTDGDGFADQELPLNDSNGDLYTPYNQCRYENYVNVADVTFEVVAFIRYGDKYTIKNGESVRMKNLYIEAQESEAGGLQSGRIVFDKKAPYGSLIIEDKIIVRRRIYPNQWHDLAFPIEMQGVGGANGICAVGANGTLGKLPADKVALYEFNSEKRNSPGGYGTAFDEVLADTLPSFKANKLYKFAADVPDGFTANDAGDGIDGVNSYWIQFHSVDAGFVITPSAAKTETITFKGENDPAAEYWNKNVFTLYNPFLSNINVKEVTSSLGWENITWWNAAKGKYEGVSAAETRDMPPFFGYWIQLTENVADGATASVVLGDASRQDYPYANNENDKNDRVVEVVLKMAPRASLSSSFDVPDAYTVGIDAAADASNAKAVSTTMVTLTDDGSVDEFRAGYDMPVSLSTTSTSIPEIWTKAGSTSMMFNDVQRKDEVVVPMGIRIKEAGEYALRLTHTNDTTSLVQLRDKETGALVDLQSDGQASTYLFLADEGDANRFDLIISKAPKMVTDLEFVETLQGEQNAQVYVRGDNLCLSNISTDYSVSVCDVLGREYLRTPITDSEMTIPLPVMRGVYVVNILDEQNASIQSVKLTK